MPSDVLDSLVERLERAAAELRSGDLDPGRAAALVDECARLAAEAGTQLDREMRAADSGAGGDGYPDQLRLGSEAVASARREAG
jgi:hypothetical protein